MRPWSTPPPHMYLDDGTEDHRGEGRCCICGTPRSNAKHQMDLEENNDQAEHRRRVGERE